MVMMMMMMINRPLRRSFGLQEAKSPTCTARRAREPSGEREAGHVRESR